MGVKLSWVWRVSLTQVTQRYSVLNIKTKVKKRKQDKHCIQQYFKNDKAEYVATMYTSDDVPDGYSGSFQARGWVCGSTFPSCSFPSS